MTDLGIFPAPASDQLAAAVPQWWATDDPTSQISLLLGVLGGHIDDLSNSFLDTYSSRSLANCDLADLIAQYALVYGVDQEQLPPTVEALRPYMQAVAAFDGSRDSLVAVLMALLNLQPANITGGPVLTFDAGGAGLTFPPSGLGLIMYQFEVGSELTGGLTFPPSGLGLIFPLDPSALAGVEGLVMPTDGLSSVGGGNGLTFAINAYLTITEQTPTVSTFTVTIKSWLAFDRLAFARAIERLRPYHLTAPLIIEAP